MKGVQLIIRSTMNQCYNVEIELPTIPIFKSKLRKSQLINHAAREKADASKELRLSFIINPILYISPDGAPAKKEPQEQGYSNSSFELPTSTVELTNRTLRVHAPTDTEKRSAQKGIRAYLSGYSYSYYTKRDKRSRLNSGISRAC